MYTWLLGSGRPLDAGLAQDHGAGVDEPQPLQAPLSQILQVAELFGHVLAPAQGGQHQHVGVGGHPRLEGGPVLGGGLGGRYPHVGDVAVDDGGPGVDAGQALFDQLVPAEGHMGVALSGGGAVEGDFDDDRRGVHGG